MGTFDQDSIITMAQQILEEDVTDNNLTIRIFEIVEGKRVLRFEYDSFLEFVAKSEDDCSSLDTYNDFYFEWETKD